MKNKVIKERQIMLILHIGIGKKTLNDEKST